MSTTSTQILKQNIKFHIFFRVAYQNKSKILLPSPVKLEWPSRIIPPSELKMTSLENVIFLAKTPVHYINNKDHNPHFLQKFF